ncbi:hypothetical protein [Chryseobacterium sp. Bi04]|nr:hypothetical protein [Chryseobacterium sp. Bi04]
MRKTILLPVSVTGFNTYVQSCECTRNAGQRPIQTKNIFSISSSP